MRIFNSHLRSSFRLYIGVNSWLGLKYNHPVWPQSFNKKSWRPRTEQILKILINFYRNGLIFYNVRNVNVGSNYNCAVICSYSKNEKRIEVMISLKMRIYLFPSIWKELPLSLLLVVTWAGSLKHFTSMRLLSIRWRSL